MTLLLLKLVFLQHEVFVRCHSNFRLLASSLHAVSEKPQVA